MKKSKANAVLATFVFGFTLLVLCSFGIDAAYVILSRQKLQKITEAVAVEYASSLNANIDNTDDLKNKYESVYNILGSGVLVFEIQDMEYKKNALTNKTAVKILTTSRVYPAFLKMVGVGQIIIHSTACAQSNQIEITKTISASSDDYDVDTEGSYANISTAYVEFAAPFEPDTSETSEETSTDEISSSLISAKNLGSGDFSINFAYDNSSGLGQGGGFFIFGGNGSNWTDIGDKVLSGASYQKVTANSLSFYCVNASDAQSVVFDLTTQSNTGGEAKRISNIRVYKALGSAALKADGTYNNPCESDDIDYNYFNRNADVKLTILGDVRLIKISKYNSFTSDEE